MIEVRDLLSRFEHILLKEENKSTYVKQAILETTGIDIPKESIQIKNGTVYLDIKPIYKSEIFLKQEQIFKKIQEFFSKNPPKKIR